jgi:hypothetical protein
MPNFEVFVDLMAQPNAEPSVKTPINLKLNEALGQVEAELQYKGGDLVPLLNEVQSELALQLKEALGYHDGP